ncbi:sulfatase-like hydrolase/transferase [Pleomorphovibrio marinus]|uniref:sulfatase-like hydrolase/transferase n=1 Tax=Pleomorphovibrio marinus TaxID=2164132 RepID=UPI001E41FD89|nr:sulfatase-like hydrolase/transferase [Pleomorphovibrio marinus]
MTKAPMRFFIVVVCISLGFSCSPSYEELPPPNILWISHEDLSPIYGCYGDDYASTPNIDKLAESSIRFTRAYSNAPICAPARSTLISGQYAVSLGTQHLRSEIPVPSSMRILPEILRDAGYYTSNNVKTDYNFSHEGRWDESSSEAHWRNGPEGQPFFSVFNFMITHEGPTNALRASDTEQLAERRDPEKAKLPPYIPDSPRMRQIWAHMYDLLAVFDEGVGDLLNQLEEDNLLDNTIIFVFSDHGHGLPGHKRWLNNAGLQIPFILHVPEKYKELASNIQGQVSDRMVGFVDFAPTVIRLAGAEVPEMMEGINFLGPEAEENPYIFGYRDRADDCYEVSRSVFDGRYLYVRHFMPQLPYFQQAIIFNKGGSYEEFNRLANLGQLPQETQKMYTKKPVEQLFDLQEDPHETTNLIGEERHASLLQNLGERLDDWMVKHRDTGLLNEGDMMTRAVADNSSVYEMARAYSEADYRDILAGAKAVGKFKEASELQTYFDHHDSAVRFWALIAADAHGDEVSGIKANLLKLLDDESLAVGVKAAEICIRHSFHLDKAYKVLEKGLKDDYEPLVLQAAISTRLLEEKAMPLLPVIQGEIMPKYSGEIWERYRSWSYPMFIGMALDQTQINCGVAIDTRR